MRRKKGYFKGLEGKLVIEEELDFTWKVYFLGCVCARRRLRKYALDIQASHPLYFQKSTFNSLSRFPPACVFSMSPNFCVSEQFRNVVNCM